MSRTATFFRWLGTPFRAIRSWVPYTGEGRQTLLYMVLAGCAPALHASIMWAMNVVKTFPGATGEARLAAYVKLAEPISYSLLIIVISLAMFVSLRSLKFSKDGLDVQGRDLDKNEIEKAIQAPATAAQEKADEVKHDLAEGKKE